MIKFVLKYSLSLSIIWALIILALCSIPGQYIPSVSLLEMLSFDKLVHAGMFFTLCTLIFFTIKQRTDEKKQIYLFLIICISYGCTLEVMQGTLFSNRSADWNDIIANSFGCLLSLFLYARMYNYLIRIK